MDVAPPSDVVGITTSGSRTTPVVALADCYRSRLFEPTLPHDA